MGVLRAFIVVGLSVVFLAIAGIPMLVAYTTAYTGFHPGPIGTPPELAKTVVDVGSPAYRAGIRTGDIVSCVSGRDGEILFPAFQGAAYEPDPIHACVIRGGTVHNVVFSALPGPAAQSTYGTYGLAALRVLVFAVFLVVGCLLVIARPSLMTWLLFAYCLGTVPGAVATDGLTVLPSSIYAPAVDILGVVSYLGSAFLLLFAIVVPDEKPPPGWRTKAFLAASAITITLAITQICWRFVVPSFAETIGASVPQLISRILTLTVIVIAVVRLVTTPRETRARFAWVAFAMAAGVVANYMRLVPDATVANIGGMLTVVMPLVLMYAILRRHVIDVRFVISRAVVFGLITTIAVAVIAAVDWATSQYLSQLRLALAIDALIAIALGFALHRSYDVIENVVDFYIYRKKHQAELYLRRLARTLLSSESQETIDRALVEDPYVRLELTMAVLFRDAGSTFVSRRAAGSTVVQDLAFDREHDLVRFLCTERKCIHIHDLGESVEAQFSECGAPPVIAIPIFDGNDLFGFSVYGLHRDGTRLDPDEVAVLEALCETAAQAYVRVEALHYRHMLSATVS